MGTRNPRPIWGHARLQQTSGRLRPLGGAGIRTRVSAAPLWGIYGRSLLLDLDAVISTGRLTGVQSGISLTRHPTRRGALEPAFCTTPHPGPKALPGGTPTYLEVGTSLRQRRFSLVFPGV